MWLHIWRSQVLSNVSILWPHLVTRLDIAQPSGVSKNVSGHPHRSLIHFTPLNCAYLLSVPSCNPQQHSKKIRVLRERPLIRVSRKIPSLWTCLDDKGFLQNELHLYSTVDVKHRRRAGYVITAGAASPSCRPVSDRAGGTQPPLLDSICFPPVSVPLNLAAQTHSWSVCSRQRSGFGQRIGASVSTDHQPGCLQPM